MKPAVRLPFMAAPSNHRLITDADIKGAPILLQPSSAAASPMSALPTSTELAALLAQVADEVPAAFDDLYLRTQGTVLRTTHAVLRDRAQAEEVTQEVFLYIWAHASRFDVSKGSAASWIWRIAHGRAVDRVRHAQSVRAHDDRYTRLHIEREVDTVADTALRDCDLTALHEALGRLTTLQRQAMVLIYFAGHTHLQASRLLGIPLGTFKSRILAGLIALRRVHPGYECAASSAPFRAAGTNRGSPVPGSSVTSARPGISGDGAA